MFQRNALYPSPDLISGRSSLLTHCLGILSIATKIQEILLDVITQSSTGPRASGNSPGGPGLSDPLD